MTWTLADMEATFRAVTGSPSQDQIATGSPTLTGSVYWYLNNYYVYKMPHELKEQIENEFLDFKTVVGQDVYSFPNGYFTGDPGAYADGFPLVFYQDKDIFYQDWPQQYAVDNLFTGNGSTSNFVGGLQNPPIIIGTCFVTDGVQVLQDAGNGTFTGDGTGTINYVTGAINVTFSSPPPTSATIYAKYQGYAANRPQGCLFFENEFTLRPVPDQVYQIRLQGFIIPTTLTNSTDTPLQAEWGPLIAYGAALDLFADRGDTDNYDRYFGVFKRYENIALSRTIQQYTSEQSVPRF